MKMKQQQQQKQVISSMMQIGLSVLALALVAHSVAAVITVQIGGVSRLNSLTRNRERYSCFWDCDLVGCQIARDDDECAYDCEKICRLRYDYSATGRSGANSEQTPASGADSELAPKSSPVAGDASGKSSDNLADNELPAELTGGKCSLQSTLINRRARV